MTEPTKLPVHLELFVCERLSARLTVKACGSRFMRVRSATPGQQDYDSACDRCPVGEHHAKHGTLCPDTTTQAPATTVAIQPTQTPTTTTTTTTIEEKTTMGAPSEYTDEQKREVVRRVLINNKSQSELATELSVTSTTIRNWIKRWGKEVASDAMDAAAAGATKPTKLERAAKAIAEPKQKRAAKVAPEDQAERATEVKRPSVSGGLESGLDALALGDSLMRVLDVPATAVRQHLGVLGSELAAAVCQIADRRARGAVADAAWLLTQAASA